MKKKEKAYTSEREERQKYRVIPCLPPAGLYTPHSPMLGRDPSTLALRVSAQHFRVPGINCQVKAIGP